MTDNEIIKALECCTQTAIGQCLKTCPYYNYRATCIKEMLKDVLDLINRQKAEIVETRRDLLNEIYALEHQLKTAKSEARNEFVKRFEKKIKNVNFTIGQTWEIQCALKQTAIELSEVSDNA